jgi:hypothetical protein
MIVLMGYRVCISGLIIKQEIVNIVIRKMQAMGKTTL